MVKVTSITPNIDFITIKKMGTNSSFIIKGYDKRIIIESGYPSELKLLLNGLNKIGLTPQDIDYFATTHIHLDHCGAGGQLVKLNPKIKVLVHEKGAKHLVNPEKLNKSALKAYGADIFPFFGELVPVPETQLIPLHEGDEIDLGNEIIKVYYTPGHAQHHVCYFIKNERILFTGDLLGKLTPNILKKQDYPIIVTPPPEYDKPLILESIERMRKLDPKLLLYTHMGPAPTNLIDRIFEKLPEEHELFVNEIKELLKSNDELSGDQIIEGLKPKIPGIEMFPDNHRSYRMVCNGIKRYLLKNNLI